MILGSALLVIGGVSLWWGLAETWKERDEVARCQAKYSTETDDYMKQYNEWLRLPADERTTFPLLLDRNGKTKTRAQLKQEQQERLKADLEKLASAQTKVPAFADVLYGENWPAEIDAYKKRNELNKHVLTGSVVCTSMGGAIYAWWCLLAAGRAILKGLARVKQWAATSRPEFVDADDETTGATDLTDIPPEEPASQQRSQQEKHPKIPPRSNWGHWAPIQRDTEVNAEMDQIRKISNEADGLATLLSDEKARRVETSTVKPLDPRQHAEPLDNTLKELSQEVSAIREYTSYQQDRLEKLQDGYDWNIIRTFCLRVIRCIDNLDNRISGLSSKNGKAAHLAEVRDELIFALESSGVEQFNPEVNSEYRGQEKYAEAVKDRQPSEQPEQKGKVATVIRPGYQYFISEENIKVVRPAQVKLFG
jgi:molecular chaperone GrpE (heat shock protein)